VSFLPLQFRKKIVPTIYQTKINWLRRYNRISARERTLPNFIIVGAMKAGTTSLSSYLSKHPQVIPSITKEIHFFDGGKNPQVDIFAKGEKWYRAHFPKKNEIKFNTKVFEATPAYLFNPDSPKRILKTIPNVKIIILLRNPTERAISHYLHGARRNWDPLPCYKALQAEEERLKPIIAAQDYKSRAFIEYSYKSRGLYLEQIKRYLEYFPREQMLILNSNDLFTQTENALKRVFDFVEIDSTFKVEDLTIPNSAPNKKKFEPAVYDYLNDYFKPHNEALFEFMGEDYGWNR